MERTKRHRLRDIIILAIFGVICGGEGWVEIEECGKAKEAWFTDLLSLPNGIPSHDTFGWVFAHIDPNQFEASFFEWVQGISKTVQGVIAIDGKMSHVLDKAKLPKILRFYVILASICCARKNRLVLASMPSVSRLVGTPSISSAFWMGLIRCDCPAGSSDLKSLPILQLPIRYIVNENRKICRIISTGECDVSLSIFIC